MFDYTRLNDGELYHELGADGSKWAEAFKQHNPGCNVDDGQLLGWFCNAVMAGHDAALGNPPTSKDEIERVADAIQREASENGADSPVDRGDAEYLARAAITALRSGERG